MTVVHSVFRNYPSHENPLLSSTCLETTDDPPGPLTTQVHVDLRLAGRAARDGHGHHLADYLGLLPGGLRTDWVAVSADRSGLHHLRMNLWQVSGM